MIRDILNNQGDVIGQMELPDGTNEEVWAQKLAFFSQDVAEEDKFYFPSVAVDLENEDMEIPNDDWIELSASRVIWDTNENYQIPSNNFVPDKDGIYSFDIQVQLKDLSNVKYVEVAVFKRAHPEDDYWFIISKEKVPDGEGEIHIGGNTSFDFYNGDLVCVKVKLHKSDSELPCSGKINGSDDYTAWGYNFIRNI